jgi:hypothetical protein
MLDDYIFQFETNLESTFKYAAIGNVLQFCVHNGVALSWLSVLEIDANPDTTIHSDGSSLLNVL